MNVVVVHFIFTSNCKHFQHMFMQKAGLTALKGREINVVDCTPGTRKDMVYIIDCQTQSHRGNMMGMQWHLRHY